MKSSEIRSWLGLYVLIFTAVVGGYFFVAPSIMVPLEMPDKIASTEILLPFLLGQMAVVFRFYSSSSGHKDRRVNIPVWVVKAPPILVSIVLLSELVLMAIGGLTRRADLIPYPESFKAFLTFCVAFLNASTVFVITRYFEARPNSASPSSG